MRATAPFDPPSLAAPARAALLERHGGWFVSGALHAALFALLFAWQLPPLLVPDAPPNLIRVTLAEPPPPPAPAPLQVAALPPQATPPPLPEAAAALRAAQPAAPGGEAGVSAIVPEAAPTVEPTVAPPPPAANPAEARSPRRVKLKAAEVVATPPPANATGATPATDEPPRADHLSASVDGAPAESAEAAASAEPVLTPEQAALAARIQQEGELLAQTNAAQATQGSGAVAQQLRAGSVDLKAKELLYDSQGAEEGAVRELDVSGIPEAQARQVLARYGIRILAGYGEQVNTGGPGGAFLSSAQTPGQRYTNLEHASGPLMIFQYGPLAIQRMLNLEAAALKARGQSPAATRIVRAVFGIAPTAEGYDLVIKRLEVSALPPLPPGAAAPPTGIRWQGLKP